MSVLSETGVDNAAEMRMRHVLRSIAAEKIAPVALYGAGAHTAKVIRALLESPVRIAGFVDESPARQEGGICGWPVVSPEEVERLGVRGVVINTDRHEGRIWERRAELEAKGLRVFRLYPELGRERPDGVESKSELGSRLGLGVGTGVRVRVGAGEGERAPFRDGDARGESSPGRSKILGNQSGAKVASWLRTRRGTPGNAHSRRPVDRKSTSATDCYGAGDEKLSHGGVQEYWRSRGDGDEADNAPSDYLGHVGWSVLVGEWLEQAGVPRDARIVELGCNVGRNLAWLRRRGWPRVAGVELNTRAVSLMHAYFPETAAAARVEVGTMEDVLPKLPDGAFDVCLTMAVFMCVHPAAECVFREASRVTRRWMLTVEDETNDGERYFPRDYSDVFAKLGWSEERALAFSDVDVETGKLLGLQAGYVMRLLRKD